MKEFTDDEKIIARNIDKEYKWMARDKSGFLMVFAQKPYKDTAFEYWTSSHQTGGVSVFKEIFKSITWEDKGPTLIEDIYNPPILDDKERKYLTAALSPLPKVKYIIKARNLIFQKKEYLSAEFEMGEIMVFPSFEERTMYKGMKADKAYTPEELRLDL